MESPLIYDDLEDGQLKAQFESLVDCMRTIRNMTEEEVQDINRGDGIDVEAIRTEVLTAMKDPSGEALKAIRAKYPILGKQRYKN